MGFVVITRNTEFRANSGIDLRLSFSDNSFRLLDLPGLTIAATPAPITTTTTTTTAAVT